MKQYDVVRVVAIRNNRFDKHSASYQRNPAIGDTGTVLEVYTAPRLAYEVECLDANNGYTIWLEAMFPDELTLIEGNSR